MGDTVFITGWAGFLGSNLSERLLAEGGEAYPVAVPRTTTLAEIRRRYADLPTDTATGDHAQQNLALLEAGPERR